MQFLRPILFLRVAGVLVCIFSAVTTDLELIYNKSANRALGCFVEWFALRAHWGTVPTAVLEASLLGVFAIAFVLVTREDEIFSPRKRNLVLLGVQSALALITAPELLMLVSSEVGLLLAFRWGLMWIGLQTVLQVLAFYLQTLITGDNPLLRLMDASPDHMGSAMVIMALASVVWHLMAYGLGLLGATERRQARELARMNAELRAARQLEADSARLAERLNLSRELHDSSGHHLAALSVNLRLMRHLSDRAKLDAKLDESLHIVQSLLTEVRGVVRDLRNVGALDLKTAIATMAAGIPGLQVHAQVEEDLAATEPYQAHALFRCVQEIITNTVKHSGARNLWIEIHKKSNSFELVAHDDGRGASHISFGNGLTGIRERVVELGGELSVHSRAGEGFGIMLQVPIRGRAA